MSLKDQIAAGFGRLASAIVALKADVDALGGPGAGVPQVFVQDEAPVVPNGTPYIWIQKNLPDGGTTVWFDDGV